MRREEGQILPGLLVVLLALLAVGMMMFQVGKAAVLRSSAQTAADAAALAGAKEIRRQLEIQWATTGTTDTRAIDQGAVIAQMRRYADLNDAVLRDQDIVGVDVKAWVTTKDALGEGAKPLHAEDEKGTAKARARIELAVGLGGGGANIGPLPGGGGAGSGPVPKISDKEWKALGEKIHKGAPVCADVITLGKFLQSKNFAVSENAAFGGITAQHEPGGWHYKCNNAGAIDVNFGGPGDLDPAEVAAVDPMIGPLRELGYRTIWRAAGHFNHLHVDIANSGAIGAGTGGSDGGFAGPLEDVLLTVRLIDWDAPASPFFGLGGVGGGYFAGPPDPKAARAICEVARRLHASDKVILAAYEAAIVESGVHSLNWGDATSVGVFQQQDWWGTRAQRLDPYYASHEFLIRAIRQNRSYMSAGQLAQDVQRSAFPLRYDQHRIQALALIGTYCS